MSQGLVAWNHLSDGMETSFNVIAQSAGDATVEVIQKRYGNEAAQVAAELADVSKSLILIYFDARYTSTRTIMILAVSGARLFSRA